MKIIEQKKGGNWASSDSEKLENHDNNDCQQ